MGYATTLKLKGETYMKHTKWRAEMKRTNVLTIILALFWVLIIILGTLSPLAQSGDTSSQVGNQFGDMGMWSAIGLILILFFLPLYFYNKGSNGAKIALAIIIAIFILGSIVLFKLAFIFLLKDFSVSLTLIVTFGLSYIVFSIAWYVISFRTR